MTERRHHSRATLLAIGLAVLALGACGGDDDAADDTADDSGPTSEDAATETAAPAGDDEAGGDAGGDDPADDPADEAAAPAGGAGGGTLVLGDDTIELESARCFLQEQDAAAGGGKILFVAQGMGTTADGEPVLVDVSRYDEDSQFVGDDILVDIGDPFSGETVSYSGGGEIGTVTVDGSTVSADGLTFQNFDDFSEVPGSVVINC